MVPFIEERVGFNAAVKRSPRSLLQCLIMSLKKKLPSTTLLMRRVSKSQPKAHLSKVRLDK